MSARPRKTDSAPDAGLVQPGSERGTTEPRDSGPETRPLANALSRLDALLGVAVEHQARRLGPASLMDPWLGMHLDQADVQRLLSEQQHQALAAAYGAASMLAAAMRQIPSVSEMARALALEDIDLAAMLIALAPDVDLRYERIFGYLQDDITHKRPSLDLMANLLAIDPGQRLSVCARFGRNAPLAAHRLMASVGGGERSPLAQDWQVDPIWRSWLLRGELADVLPPGSTENQPRETLRTLAVDPATCDLLEQACRLADTLPLRLCLHGGHGAGKHDAAAAVAHRLGLQLVPLDLRNLASPLEVSEAVERGARTACLFAGLLYVHGLGQLEQRDLQLIRAAMAALAIAPCHVVLSCVAPPPAVHAPALPLLRIELPFPSASARHQLWQRATRNAAVHVPEEDLARLAARFSLSSPQIFQAAAEAQVLAMAQGRSELAYRDIAAAVRRQCGSELARMATRITPQADFTSLVVPVEVQTQLREICARVATRDTIAHEWAADSVHARSTGVTALFVGPSGTGKTLSAEALANELGLDLYRIDLAGIVSKYIGETEKNLDRVFAAATHANAVLFFDEADALFGKRSEVKDAHDRYANIEVAYLLQKMEQFDGLAILATNLKQNLDEAFARRLTFTVNFPFPEEAERCLLWETLWPPRAPRADDVDLAWFAREYRLSGGNIRNTVMAAAHLAAADGKVVTRAHLLHATRREFQKLGKNLTTPAEGMKP
jgi:ATP-dependent 26S proteasome regulatory subunit